MRTKGLVRTLYKKGLSYKEISEKVGVAKSTISFHCSDLAKKRVADKKRQSALRKKAEKEDRERHRQNKRLKRKKAKFPYSGFYFYYKKSKDGRVRLHLINPDTNEVRFKLLARYRLEVKLKRFLTKDETVDHIDEDKTLENESATLNLVEMQTEDPKETVCDSKDIKPFLSLVSELEAILNFATSLNSKSLENYTRLVRNFGTYN